VVDQKNIRDFPNGHCALPWEKSREEREESRMLVIAWTMLKNNEPFNPERMKKPVKQQ